MLTQNENDIQTLQIILDELKKIKETNRLLIEKIELLESSSQNTDRLTKHKQNKLVASYNKNINVNHGTINNNMMNNINNNVNLSHLEKKT